ncbi:uncharacterized protein EI97DRAFT_445620 [Westerdykella ornata]|uniref:Uncharacterized protein n=1 Tax=Westerdykella ornata TaxID=318751 RepID=A0A6A6JBH0_WESOR|nr:uncharacterized protein EI97DRAFT_445620 [Westerdykella ornata]KAF2272539.1 hypothetical protein EI97DRAFT_445620 [Westerdykella ornata]
MLPFKSLILLAASIPLNTILAAELVPLRQDGFGKNRKRQDIGGLDLKTQESFIWGSPDASNAVANLTIYMQGENENLLSMEAFDGMLTSVHCSADLISMTFSDDSTFAHAQRVWDWVNGAENNSFVMIAGVGDCGNNTRRIPYIVSTVTYDEGANEAKLAVARTTWSGFAHSYDLTVRHLAETSVFDSMRVRDIGKTASIDFTHAFPFSFAIGAQGLQARLTCANCSSTGSFEMEFKVSQRLFIPTDASIKIGQKRFLRQLKSSCRIVEIPLSGIKVPGILDLGPFLSVSAGAELSAITLSAGVQSGATAVLEDAAILEVDLLNPEQNKFSGWEPHIDFADVRVDASISGGVAVFLKPAIELQAEVLGRGFAIGLNMKLPNINAKLETIASPQGACPAAALPEGVENAEGGVRISTNVGGSLNLAAKKSSDDDPIFTVQLAALDRPIAQTCFPLHKAVVP